jgi:hypothetical protein
MWVARAEGLARVLLIIGAIVAIAGLAYIRITDPEEFRAMREAGRRGRRRTLTRPRIDLDGAPTEAPPHDHLPIPELPPPLSVVSGVARGAIVIAATAALIGFCLMVWIFLTNLPGWS